MYKEFLEFLQDLEFDDLEQRHLQVDKNLQTEIAGAHEHNQIT